MALALAGTLTSGFAAAQEAAPDDGGDVVLDTIEVTGAATGLAAGTTEGTGFYNAPATNTATKFALTPRETPQTVTVVTDQVVRDFALTDMRDVLETAPFISVFTERTPGTFVATARGSEDLAIQFDGIPGPDVLGDRAAFPIDTAFIDRTEIIFGAQGLLGGFGGLAGTLNMVRKMPTTERFYGGEAMVDERGSYRLVGDVSGPLNTSGRLRGRLIGVLDDYDSFVDEAWTKRQSAYGVLEADVADGTTLALGGWVTDSDQANGSAYGLPTMIDGSFVDLPRSTNLGADWSRDRRNAQVAFLKLDQDLPGSWELRGALNYAHSKSRLTEAIAQGPFMPGTNYEYAVQGQKEGWGNTIWSLDAYAAGTARLFGRTHELMVGVNGLHNDGDSQGGLTTVSTPNPFGYGGIIQMSNAFTHDPTGVPQPGDDEWSMWYWESTVKQYGGYVGGRFSINDPTHLILGARAGRWEYEDAGGSSDYDAVIPYAALTYDFSAWGTVYAAYSRVYDPVNWAVGPDLKPIDPREGHNYEVGAKGSFFDGRLDASVALYRLDQKNIPVEDVEGGFDCFGWYCYKPSGEVNTTGVDIGVSGRITENWNILAGYSYSSAEEEDGGVPFNSLYPEQTAKLSTTYDLPGDRWTIGGQIRWQSETYADGDYAVSDTESVPYHIEQPAYTLVDLMAKYRINDGVHVVLNVDNVFDKTYYDGISYVRHGNTYGAPRTASLTLRAAF